MVAFTGRRKSGVQPACTRDVRKALHTPKKCRTVVGHLRIGVAQRNTKHLSVGCIILPDYNYHMQSKAALIIVFNHRYDKNIPLLETLYEGRFSNIYYLVPFYDGEKENVIPVYENSFRFQG